MYEIRINKNISLKWQYNILGTVGGILSESAE